MLKKLSVEGRWLLFAPLIVAVTTYVIIWNYTKGDMGKVEMVRTYEEDAIDYGQVRPPTAIVFHGTSEKEIGRLDWTDGKFKFVGNADESAKVFFDYFLKPYIDGYIEDGLRRDEYIGIEFVSEDYEKNKSFLIRVTVDGEEMGIVYFDENDVIQFRGDKEQFEQSMLKLLKAGYGKEEK